ncbi:MAG: hypothetical protein HY266_03470 [Deltaproteobacteria bacterium]|nr:hypothetical protein [Deltaproteobacteria bacterium]
MMFVSDVLIHDYLDSANAMLLKMYRNRLKAYRKMGYIVQQAQGETGSGNGSIPKIDAL